MSRFSLFLPSANLASEHCAFLVAYFKGIFKSALTESTQALENLLLYYYIILNLSSSDFDDENRYEQSGSLRSEDPEELLTLSCHSSILSPFIINSRGVDWFPLVILHRISTDSKIFDPYILPVPICLELYSCELGLGSPHLPNHGKFTSVTLHLV